MKKKIVAVILGNRLQDDGSISVYQEQRLIMAMEIDEIFEPDYFILSGGIANKNTTLSEAEAMYNYLVSKGFNKEKLIIEKDSLSTVQNAKFSIPIAKKLGAEIIIICSNTYHFSDPQFRAIASFEEELKDSNITLMTYSR